MTKTELRLIAEEMAEELRKIPEEAEISSYQLLKLGGYDPKTLSPEELMVYHDYLFQAAKARRIVLDMSKHKDRSDGSPYDLEFVVENTNAEILCPYCGSRNTALILYGMPVVSKRLQEIIRSGELVLGESDISQAIFGNGEMINISPTRYCNACGKKFARPPYLMTEDKKHAEAYSEIVTGLRFEISSFSKGRRIYDIQKNADGAAVSVLDSPFDDEDTMDRQITARRWSLLIDVLFTKLYVHEWEKTYDAPGILDGEQWELEISLTNGRKCLYQGSNAYPPYWKDLKMLFLFF